MRIRVPELSLVLLIGASGSGKSTFARKHFAEHEFVSSDFCRGLVSNDENSLLATKDAFELLHFIIAKRLKRGLLTVVDATNVQQSSRQSLVKLAREYHCLPVAIVLNLDASVCEARNKNRSDRNFASYVIRQQQQQLKQSLKGSLKGLKREGFRNIQVFNSEEEVAAVTGIEREKLYSNKRELTGPFDIIGDIHGCYAETLLLLEKLNYQIDVVADNGQNYGWEVSHPEGRTVVFLGDLVDRGPDSPAVLKLVMSMVRNGSALCVPGNHDLKLQKKLNGRDVQVRHGLEVTMAQMEQESEAFKNDVRIFLYSLTSHFILDNGNLAVAHAGVKEEMQGRGSGAVRAFCLYGETTGETDEFGLPIRYNWASEYRGQAKVVYGHTPIPKAEWLNKTINIDTGCVFGGSLTALQYPEEKLVSVKAEKVYAEPSRPINFEAENTLSHQQEYDDLLNIDDVIGKRIIQTKLRNNLTIRAENSIAALEVMSRFAIDPKWLIYLPPTMSPCATSELESYLEHPQQAINYYRKRGITKLVCEEKHMGSRAVLIVCKSEETVLERFGIATESVGICYTRTGRNFFTDSVLEKAFISRVQKALTNSNFWDKHETDWVCLDCELMPWSAKAQSLLRDQYASVGASASNALEDVLATLKQAQGRNLEGIDNLLRKFSYKKEAVEKFGNAYRNYCWEVNSLDDYKLAPFHILATEGQVHSNKNHEWHMENIAAICRADEQLFSATPYKIVDTESEESIAAVTDWWVDLTAKGGEGMVVKPHDFIAYGRDGLLQPAVKCRGSEYLRIIYGAEYDVPENLSRLRKRGLSRKRSLAIREFALGMEGLDRFVNRDPLRKIHESVFAVLALESEEVDPRL